MVYNIHDDNPATLHEEWYRAVYGTANRPRKGHTGIATWWGRRLTSPGNGVPGPVKDSSGFWHLLRIVFRQQPGF